MSGAVSAAAASARVEAAASQVECEVVRAPLGYASVRNAALTRVIDDFDYLMFFDDDQVASPNHCATLISAAEAAGADVVLGPVRTAPLSKATWASPVDVRPPWPITQRAWLEGDAYTSNTLLRTSWLRESELRFDTAYDVIGGEDTNFFRAAQRQGARILFEPDAVAVETVDPCRVTAKGRFVTGVGMGVRYATVTGVSVGKVVKKLTRGMRGMYLLTTGLLVFSRPRMGRGLFDLGLTIGFLQVCKRQMRGLR